MKVTYALTYTSLKHPLNPHLTSNKADSLGQADHDPAGAKSGLQFYPQNGLLNHPKFDKPTKSCMLTLVSDY